MSYPPLTYFLHISSYSCKRSIVDVASFYCSKNRINAVGDALELFIKDIFANALNETNEIKKNDMYEQVFSYLGNANNPPDLMLINGGDAIEVKKSESENSQIALNSSYPSAKLFADIAVLNDL